VDKIIAKKYVDVLRSLHVDDEILLPVKAQVIKQPTI